MIVGSAIAFATTIVDVPRTSPLDFGHEREQPLPFQTHVAHLRHQIPRLPQIGKTGQPIRAGFYVPWDEESAVSLRAHYDQLDWIIASDATIQPKTGKLVDRSDPRLRALIRGNVHRPKVFLMVQNFDDGRWFGPEMDRLLRDSRASDALIADTIAAVSRKHWQGAVFDIENLADRTLPLYRDFLARAHARFNKAGLSLAVTVPAGEPAWDLRGFAAAVDQLILMNYDQHWQGGEAGPIAAQDWFNEQLADARAKVPASKLIVAIGSYGYDWHDDIADALTIGEAWLAARDSGAMPAFDPQSGNSGFAYEENDRKHMVWMMDAATSWNQLIQLQGVAGVALWRLGSEDPRLLGSAGGLTRASPAPAGEHRRRAGRGRRGIGRDIAHRGRASGRQARDRFRRRRQHRRREHDGPAHALCSAAHRRGQSAPDRAHVRRRPGPDMDTAHPLDPGAEEGPGDLLPDRRKMRWSIPRSCGGSSRTGMRSAIIAIRIRTWRKSRRSA